MTLITVSAKNPHLILQHSITGSVPAFPIQFRIKRRGAKGVRFFQTPAAYTEQCRNIGRTCQEQQTEDMENYVEILS